MILTIPLQPGTVLANVRYRWIAAGAIGAALSAGITQPSTDFPVFRIDAAPPTGAEEIVAYDNTDLTNWNAGQYKIAATLAKLEEATHIILTFGGGGIIVPDVPDDLTVCRVYGYFEDLANKPSNNIDVVFKLTEPGPVKSERLITGRSITAKIVDGVLTDADGNPWQDLQRNDNLTPTGTKYLITCPELGLLDFAIGPIAAPDAREISLTTATFDLATIIT